MKLKKYSANEIQRFLHDASTVSSWLVISGHISRFTSEIWLVKTRHFVGLWQDHSSKLPLFPISLTQLPTETPRSKTWNTQNSFQQTSPVQQQHTTALSSASWRNFPNAPVKLHFTYSTQPSQWAFTSAQLPNQKTKQKKTYYVVETPIYYICMILLSLSVHSLFLLKLFITFRNPWHSIFSSCTRSWSCLLDFWSLVVCCCRRSTCLFRVLLSVSEVWALVQASFLAFDWKKGFW